MPDDVVHVRRGDMLHMLHDSPDGFWAHAAERAGQGIAPLPLTAQQVGALTAALETFAGEAGDAEARELVRLLEDRVAPGVDDSAYVKAGWLTAVARGEAASPLVSQVRAVELLGTMQGGYNIDGLVGALDDPELSAAAAAALKDTLLMFDAFHDVDAKAKAGMKTPWPTFERTGNSATPCSSSCPTDTLATPSYGKCCLINSRCCVMRHWRAKRSTSNWPPLRRKP